MSLNPSSGLQAPVTGQKNVTTAGTAVKLSTTSVPCTAVLVRAKIGNTQKIAIGPVGTTYAGNNGYVLSAGDAVSIPTVNLNLIYIDSQVNGEGVYFLAT